MELRKEDKMDESSNDEMFGRRDFRKKKEKKRSHRSSKEKEEYSKESFKKMKQEIDELRKKEVERATEFEKLKKQIEWGSTSQKKEKIEYALGYDEEEYLNKGFIESAKWIKNIIAKNMSEKILQEQYKTKFFATSVSKKASTHMGIRTCARYNRGEDCNLGKWHATHKSAPLWNCTDARQRIGGGAQELQQEPQYLDHQNKRNEIRLHACTLCLEALMSINGHSVLRCPWILKKNWSD